VTVFHLIRHGEHELQDRVLVGRAPGVALSPRGRAQAERLAARLAREEIAAIYASPLERAQETARPIAAHLGIEMGTDEALQEMDVGAWTGRPVNELVADRAFQLFNRFRSGSPPPGGESMLDVQCRMVALVERLRRQIPGADVALVGHGDPIKAVLAYYLGVPLDLSQRIEVATGSLSRLEVEEWGPRLLGLNEVPA
jgi:broad specificity phosphatase PhoE